MYTAVPFIGYYQGHEQTVDVPSIHSVLATIDPVTSWFKHVAPTWVRQGYRIQQILQYNVFCTILTATNIGRGWHSSFGLIKDIGLELVAKMRLDKRQAFRAVNNRQTFPLEEHIVAFSWTSRFQIQRMHAKCFGKIEVGCVGSRSNNFNGQN